MSEIDLALLPSWLHDDYRLGFIRGFCLDYRKHGNRWYRIGYRDGAELRAHDEAQGAEAVP